MVIFTSFQFDCDGRPYLDIYDIVCDGGNITDVKPIIGKTVGDPPLTL